MQKVGIKIVEFIVSLYASFHQIFSVILTMLNNVKWIIFFLLLLSITAGCSEGNNSDLQITTLENPRSVSVTPVQRRNLARRFEASGILVPRELASASSELSGYIVSQLHYEAGDKVRKGEVLATLDGELLSTKISQAEAILEQADAQSKQAYIDLERVNALEGRNFLSEEKIQAQRTQAKVAAANLKKVTAELENLNIQKRKLQVKAPVTGLILERNVHLGDFVTNGQSLFTIAQDGLVEVDTEIPEQFLVEIELDQSVSVRLSSGVMLEGKVRLISPQIDPFSKLGRARISLSPNNAITVGGFAQVTFRKMAEPTLVVPENAIHFESNGPSLIVIDNNNRAKRVMVKTTSRFDGLVAIESGVEAGDLVALGGGAFLLDGDLINPVRVNTPSNDE